MTPLSRYGNEAGCTTTKCRRIGILRRGRGDRAPTRGQDHVLGVPEFYDGAEWHLREVRHVWRYEWVQLSRLFLLFGSKNIVGGPGNRASHTFINNIEVGTLGPLQPRGRREPETTEHRTGRYVRSSA